MCKRLLCISAGIALLGLGSGGCAPAPTPAPTPSPVSPTFTPSPVPPTSTPEPTSTATASPTPTALPGLLVLPLDTLDNRIPWLPMDPSARPGVYYFYFNLAKPPFNNVLVRQAFAAAIDRQALVEIADKYRATNPRPATSLTPPGTLGRDLYGEVGISFDPTRAKELLTQAGYTDSSSFPPVQLVINLAGDPAPGFHVKITDAMVKMWREALGVEVTVQVLSWDAYRERVRSNPPDIGRLGWVADVNDPDNFLREIFKSSSQYNYGHFSNTDFDRLVDRAAERKDPAERQALYIEAERILCETEAALIPIFHSTYNIP